MNTSHISLPYRKIQIKIFHSQITSKLISQGDFLSRPIVGLLLILKGNLHQRTILTGIFKRSTPSYGSCHIVMVEFNVTSFCVPFAPVMCQLLLRRSSSDKFCQGSLSETKGGINVLLRLCSLNKKKSIVLLFQRHLVYLP